MSDYRQWCPDCDALLGFGSGHSNSCNYEAEQRKEKEKRDTHNARIKELRILWLEVEGRALMDENRIAEEKAYEKWIKENNYNVSSFEETERLAKIAKMESELALLKNP